MIDSRKEVIMDRWFYFHRKTFKRLGVIILVISLVIYGIFVWDINYLFRKNYHNYGYRDVSLNEYFEYKGIGFIIREFKALTAEQVIEQYGNPEIYAYDMDGNMVAMDTIEKGITYVIVRYDMKKLVDSPEYLHTDVVLYDTMTNGNIDLDFHAMLLGDNVIYTTEMRVGETISGRVMGLGISHYGMEKKYAEDPTKDEFYIVFPSESIDEKPIRIKLN